jgi:hypothetical protein
MYADELHKVGGALKFRSRLPSLAEVSQGIKEADLLRVERASSIRTGLVSCQLS